MAAGARLAAPGEFTLRAFLNGKLDLVQAEAVADLIDAVTPAQARLAFDQLDGTLSHALAAIGEALFDLRVRLEASLDFPDEGYHFVEPGAVARECEAVRAQVDRAARRRRVAGRLLREGCRVALAGAPNVGKSLLFNALLGSSRAIVTPVAGTTRDLLTERCDIGGLAVTLIDTAGVRESDEPIEQEGIARARQAAEAADVCVLVLDRSQPLHRRERRDASGGAARVIVANKSDLPAAWSADDERGAIAASALTGDGLDAVRRAIVDAASRPSACEDTPAIANARHTALLERAGGRLARRRSRRASGEGEEIVLADAAGCIRGARGDSGEAVVGGRAAPDLRQVLHRKMTRCGRRSSIVIGAGHAGCRGRACRRAPGLPRRPLHAVADTVGHMPCNPAIGGTAKGHLVREIDALGGLMGEAIDATGHPVQAAEPQPWPGGVVPARAGRQARLLAMDARAPGGANRTFAWIFDPVTALDRRRRTRRRA